jgi:hypothetical protein
MSKPRCLSPEQCLQQQADQLSLQKLHMTVGYEVQTHADTAPLFAAICGTTSRVNVPV